MSKDAYWSRFVTTRSGLVLVLFLGLPGVLCAQKEQDSWSALNGLKAGRGIEVIESHMQRHAGEFVNVTDGVLSLQEGGSDVSIKREDIVRVSTSSAPRRGEHAVIGLVVGGDQDSISSKETTTMKLRSLCVADSTQVPRLIRFSGVALDETHKPMTGMLVDRGSGLSPSASPLRPETHDKVRHALHNCGFRSLSLAESRGRSVGLRHFRGKIPGQR